MRLIFALLLPLMLAAQMTPLQFAPADDNISRHPKVKIDDAKILSFGRIDGQKFFGISALAYDRDTKRLYMLSDRSRLFVFALEIEKGKIVALKPLFAKRLRDRFGHKYFLRESDSEGMTLVREGKRKYLLVSFEQTPRLVLFDLKGQEVTMPVQKQLRDLRRRMQLTRLPKILRRVQNYRKKNSMLESVTWSPRYGMVTAPEFPLRRTKAGLHGIYGTQGRICYIRPHRFGSTELAITELETMPDGKLLALQRGVALGKSVHVQMQLLQIDLRQIEGGICRTKPLLRTSTDAGWALDNFEGLTYLGDGKYLIVSDDNDNFFQQTILLLVSIAS